MQIRRFTLPAALIMVALLGPISGASHGGFHHTGTLEGTYATPFVSSANEFAIDLVAGETITATVEWFDPMADLDLAVVSPGGGCAILPSPDVPCLTGIATGIVGRVTCPGGSDGRTLLGVSPETLTYTATVSGTHELVVLASAGDVVVSGIQYVLTIDGGANVQQPTKGSWVRADACRSV